MKWITRENVKNERVACAWLIKRFVDPEAEFLFVPESKVLEIAKRKGATPFDTIGAELDHFDGKCSFEAIIDKYQVGDPAVALLAQIVHGSHLKRDMYGRPEAAGIKAISLGFAELDLANDNAVLEEEMIVYDALYAYCRGLNRKAQEDIA